MESSRSALNWSLWVAHSPWGAPGYTFRVASLTSSTDRRAEGSMGTIWSSSAGPRAAVRRPAIGSLIEPPLSDPPTAGTTCQLEPAISGAKQTVRKPDRAVDANDAYLRPLLSLVGSPSVSLPSS